IADDGILNESEILSLQSWLDENMALKGNFPFDKILETISGTLSDGVLEDSELASMLELFEQITDPVANTCTCEFDIEGKTFCLSGEFEYGEKAAVQEILSQKGGIPVNGVTKKTDYIIVGSKGSDAWCAGSYGTKVKKALEMQEKGMPIQIVKERDLPI
ncbi:MAG: BRCT domain-containing protein, partial [Clostridia bacterium]